MGVPEPLDARRVRVAGLVGFEVVQSMQSHPKQRRAGVQGAQQRQRPPHASRGAEGAVRQQPMVADGVIQPQQDEGQ